MRDLKYMFAVVYGTPSTFVNTDPSFGFNGIRIRHTGFHLKLIPLFFPSFRDSEQAGRIEYQLESAKIGRKSGKTGCEPGKTGHHSWWSNPRGHQSDQSDSCQGDRQYSQESGQI